MKLKDIQIQLFSHIRNQNESECSFVVNDEKIGNIQRINTYRNSAYRKVEDCIEDDFQASLSFIEDNDRDRILKGYIENYPPDTHYINESGKYFLKYLHEVSYAPMHNFLFDLFQLEWLRVESFYDFFNYQKNSIEKNQIIVNPSLKIFESKWPLDIIWSSKEPRELKQSTIFIWTTEDRIVDCLSWDSDVTNVLLELIRVKSLDQSVENLLNKYNPETLAQILEKYLRAWIDKGILQINISRDS